MKWQGRRGSRNIEDRRGMGAKGAGGAGLIGMLMVLAVGYFFGVDISPMMSGTANPPAARSGQLSQEDKAYGQFVSVVLAETEDVWNQVLRDEAGMDYAEPKLVLYSGVVRSACGGASAAMGPFYCPGDRKVYLDTDFFHVMEQKMGAGGDFAAAYVVAHEIGHHVQNQIGILPKVGQMRARASKRDSNYLSVLTELQADCFAGIWARKAAPRLGVDREDLIEAINAARAVGDDVIQASAGRVPVPDSFTHGSAADRQQWFARGFDGGSLAACNSFAEAGL